MKVWNSSSSESKKCAVCGKMTSTYKCYEQTNIVIRVPLCNGKCYSGVHLNEISDLAIKLVKREITKG